MTGDDQDPDDIVFRLRAADNELCAEAADEIEGLSRSMARLMGERDRLIDQCHRWSLKVEDLNLKIIAIGRLGA